MSGYLVLPLTKSPHSRGRIGPRKLQDWYCSLKKARLVAMEFQPSTILILSNLQVAGEKHEVDLYLTAARELGISDDIEAVRETYETMGHLEYSYAKVEREGKKLIVVSTLLHFPRVWWLCRGHRVKHFVALGIPRPFGAVMDVILTFVFPVLDVLGKREWLKKRLDARRVAGKL